MKILLVVLLLALVVGCSHEPPGGQGKQRSEGYPSGGQLEQSETAKDGMARLIRAIDNDDDRLAHNPPADEASRVRDHREQARKDACSLWDRVDSRQRDVDLIRWHDGNC